MTIRNLNIPNLFGGLGVRNTNDKTLYKIFVSLFPHPFMRRISRLSHFFYFSVRNF